MTKKLLYILVIASLAGSNNFAIPIFGHQLSLFRLILFICVCSLLINLINSKEATRLTKISNNYAIIFFASWFAYSLISVLWVKDYSGWARSMYFLGIGVVSIALFAKSFATPNDFLGVFKIISIMAIVHNIIAWNEVLTGRYWLLEENSVLTYRSYEAAVSIFGNMNNFALFLCLAIFSLMISIKTERFFTLRVLYVLTLFSSILLLLNHTHSRGNIIGIAIGIVFVLFLTINNQTRIRFITLSKEYFKAILHVRGNNKTANFRVISISIIVLIFLGIGTYIFIENIQQMLTTENGSASIRVNLMKNGMLFFADSYGMGVGAGNIEYWMAHFAKFNTSGIMNMHNWWIEILVNYGLIIFIAYLLFYYKLLANLYANWRRANDSQNKVISLYTMGFMVAFIFGSISPSSVFVLEWLWIFWGVIVAYQLQITSPLLQRKKGYTSDGRLAK